MPHACFRADRRRMRVGWKFIFAMNLSINTYPANQRKLVQIEQGRISEAIVSLPPGKILAAGDSILFALALDDTDKEPVYAKFGDSVRVLLTMVTDLGRVHPATGQALFRLDWEPLGRWEAPKSAARPSKRPRIQFQ